MMQARGVTALATAALLLVAGTSCAVDNADPTGSSTPTSTSSAPTSETETPSGTDAASDSASALIRRYYAVRNELRQDPDQPLARLKTVAISSELAAQRKLFKREREEGWRQTGKTRVAELDVKSVNLDNADPDSGKVPTVQVAVCFDVSEVDIVDADGKSVVGRDRPDTGWIQYSVSNYEWETDPDGAWRVASSQDIERTPCAAA